MTDHRTERGEVLSRETYKALVGVSVGVADNHPVLDRDRKRDYHRLLAHDAALRARIEELEEIARDSVDVLERLKQTINDDPNTRLQTKDIGSDLILGQLFEDADDVADRARRALQGGTDATD